MEGTLRDPLGDVGNVLYLDLSVDYPGLYFCQNSIKCTLEVSALSFLCILLRYKI